MYIEENPDSMPEQIEPPKKKKRLWWLLLPAIAAVIALAIAFLPISFHTTDHSVTVSYGTPPDDAPMPPPDAPQPVFGSGQTLPISPSPQGADNIASNAPGALSLQEIYKKVIDSVVTITAKTYTGTALGTGIVLSSDGYIITNAHVVENGLYLSVLAADDQVYDAALIGSDIASDLAVLKIDAEGLKSAEFGDSDSLQVGDLAVAIGSPLGSNLKGTMTNGIISGISRDLTVNGRKMNLIQTNAALNNGNSGGPLINCYGQIIGVNAVKLSSVSVEGIGFAIPISTAKPIIDELIERGYVSGRPSLGIAAEDLPHTVRVYYGLPQGAYVTAVSARSDAAEKGLQKGDIITAVNGETVTGVDSLRAIKSQYSAGETVTLTVYRGGNWLDIDTVLMEQVEDR